MPVDGLFPRANYIYYPFSLWLGRKVGWNCQKPILRDIFHRALGSSGPKPHSGANEITLEQQCKPARVYCLMGTNLPEQVREVKVSMILIN